MKLSEALMCLSKMQELLKQGQPNNNLSNGLCRHLIIAFKSYNLRNEVMEAKYRWPRYTGVELFPVPHPTKSAVSGFCSTANVWIGEYGDNRRELLAFLIKDLKRRIKATKAQDDYVQSKAICVALGKVVRKEIKPAYGLCATVEEIAGIEAWGFFDDHCSEFFRSWPKFSGDVIYPVNGQNTYYYHKDVNTLYDGAEGRARRSLARHLIKEFKQMRMDLELLP